MKHIIVGTSGHIDHGKTSLIKCLTGVDTDTLKEEKTRGITINNGYTHLNLDENLNIGIIDVPGHEKFIKNMVAGVSSIDLVLFVIAADDGIMPQTIEHLNILKTLGISRGIIVLTKCDLVPEEWIELVTDDIKSFVFGTFLENAPIIKFSSKTKEGLEEIKSTLVEEINKLEEKDSETLFRMPIDRTFHVQGYGTVVTGTILGGNINIGDSIQLYPGDFCGKIRGIQVHNEDRSSAYAGDRTALNIVGIDKENISRGMIIGEEKKEISSFIVDVKIEYYNSNNKELKNRNRIRIHHGTRELLGRVVILDRDEILPGESAYCQLRLEEELCSRRGDKIVLRSFSPIETIGGGIILEACAKKAKRLKEEYLSNLKIKETGNIDEKIIQICHHERNFLNKNFIENTLNMEDLAVEMENLVNAKNLIQIEDSFIDTRFFKEKATEVVQILNEFYKLNSLKFGMSKEELKRKLFGKTIKKQYFEGFLEKLKERNYIQIIQDKVSLKNRTIKLNLDEKNLKAYLLKTYLDDGFKTKKAKEVIEDSFNKNSCKKVYEYLKDCGELIELPEEVVYSKEYLDKATEIVKKFFIKNEVMNLSDLKVELDISRKYLVAILEYCDSINLTYRCEEGRKIYKES
ncbi:MAG: selenocysteine-specific translation elongation factor [Clostridium sp.]